MLLINNQTTQLEEKENQLIRCVSDGLNHIRVILFLACCFSLSIKIKTRCNIALVIHLEFGH